MTDLPQAMEKEVAVEPPKRWQNWFHSETDVIFGNGERNRAGKWCSPNLYATVALAEEAAENDMAVFAGWVRQHGIHWLGAFPEGSRP